MQATALTRLFRENGYDVLSTTEPGGTDIGSLIRDIVLNNRLYIDPQTEALLFAADRAQHVNTTVLPALARGTTVIQDRYIDSSVAYQGAGRVLNPRDIRDLSMWAASGLEPDLTILLDLDTESARRRAEAGGRPLDRLEDEDEDFRARLRQGFLDIARREPTRFLVVDGDRPFTDVANEIAEEIAAWLSSRE
jgi:dTMP kinase